MGIREYTRDISPPWLIGPGVPSVPLPEAAGIGERIMYALIFGADACIQKVEIAVKMRFPGLGDFSALPPIGADRRIVRGFAESTLDYAGRLRRWLTTWRYAGAARGVIESVAGYIGVRPRIQTILDYDQPIVDRSTWDILDENAEPDSAPNTFRVEPRNWIWNGSYAPKLRWMVIDAANWSTSVWWIDTTLHFGDANLFLGVGDYSVGFDCSHEIPATIRSLINTWRSADTRYDWVAINFFGSTAFSYTSPAGSFDMPNATWETWSKIDTSVSAYRYLRRPSRQSIGLTGCRYFTAREAA